MKRRRYSAASRPGRQDRSLASFALQEFRCAGQCLC